MNRLVMRADAAVRLPVADPPPRPPPHGPAAGPPRRPGADGVLPRGAGRRRRGHRVGRRLRQRGRAGPGRPGPGVGGVRRAGHRRAPRRRRRPGSGSRPPADAGGLGAHRTRRGAAPRRPPAVPVGRRRPRPGPADQRVGGRPHALPPRRHQRPDHGRRGPGPGGRRLPGLRPRHARPVPPQRTARPVRLRPHGGGGGQPRVGRGAPPGGHRPVVARGRALRPHQQPDGRRLVPHRRRRP